MTERVLEGFWDSVVATTKRLGLATASAAGSSKAKGQLSAANLSNTIYRGYQTWLGSTGESESAENMAYFLNKEIQFNPTFSQQWGRDFGSFQQDPEGYLESNTDSSPDTEIDASVSSASQPTDNTATVSPVVPPAKPPVVPPVVPPATDTAVEQKLPDRDVAPVTTMDKQLLKVFKLHTIKSSFTGDSSKYQFSKSPDGSFIVVNDLSKAKQLAKLLKNRKDIPVMAQALNMGGFFKSWLEFKAENTRYSSDPNKLAVDAMMAAATAVGKNFSKELNRFILMKPKASAVSFELMESTLEEDHSDSQLRSFFTKVAQNALKTGAAKSAAKSEMSRLRVVNTPQTQYNAIPDPVVKNQEPRSAVAPAAQAAQATMEPTPMAPAAVATDIVSMAKLTPQQQKELADIENNGLGKGLEDTLNNNDPELRQLTKQILAAALLDYRKKRDSTPKS